MVCSVWAYISIKQNKLHLDSFYYVSKKEKELNLILKIKISLDYQKPIIYFKYNENEKLMWKIQNQNIKKTCKYFL